MRLTKVFIFCIAFSLIQLSCAKEKISLSVEEKSNEVNEDLYHILFLNDSIGFACGGNKYFHGYILKTADAGNTWNKVYSDAPKALYSLAFDQNKIYCTGYDGFLFMSEDTGKHWLQINQPLYKRINQICFSEPNKMFAAVGEGFDNGSVYQSADAGASWNKNDTFTKALKSITFYDKDFGLAGAYGSIYKTTDGGNSWSPTGANGDFFVDIQFTSSSTIYATGYFGKVLKSTDGGLNWKRVRNENFQLNEQSNFNHAVFIDDQIGYVVGEKGYMIRTVDGGVHWEKIEKFTDENLKAIAIRNHKAFVVASSGKIFVLTL